VFTFLCILHSALCMAVVSEAEIIDRVLAGVGGVVITQSDVIAASELGLLTADPVTDPAGTMISRLIERQLILVEVDRYAPPEPTVEAVDRELSVVRARFPSESAYKAALARSGVDEKRVRQTLRDELRIRAYLEQRFTVPPPNDEELNRYYREHLDTFTRGREVVPLDEARAEIVRTLTAARRAMLVRDWVLGLRRRAAITDLSLPRQ
jgi:hypothetical protein